MYRLHDSLGYRLTLAGRISERRLDHGLKELGLTRMSWCVLLAVGNEGISLPSDIAEFMGVNRAAISRILKDMESKGLVSRITGTADARTRAVSLTALGRDRIELATPIAVGNNAILRERLGESRSRELKALLEILIEGEPALDRL